VRLCSSESRGTSMFASQPEQTLRLEALGNHLRQMRQQTSLRRLAGQTGVSRPTLISAERGGDLQLSTLLKLLQAHGRLADFDRFVASLADPEMVTAPAT
jgi:transcriptional regulator with XRE-family HTH domain